MREPCGVARPVGAPPCEPPAWSPVDLAGDAMDMIVADDGRSMWRVELESGSRAAYACIRGRAVRLNALSDIVKHPDDLLGGEPIAAWQSAQSALSMVRLLSLLLGDKAVKMASIACARAVVDLAPEPQRAIARDAIDAAELAIRDPSQENFGAAMSVSDVALRMFDTLNRLEGPMSLVRRFDFGIGAVAAAGWAIRPGIDAVDWAMKCTATPASLAAVVRGVIPAEAIFDGLVAWAV